MEQEPGVFTHFVDAYVFVIIKQQSVKYILGLIISQEPGSCSMAALAPWWRGKNACKKRRWGRIDIESEREFLNMVAISRPLGCAISAEGKQQGIRYIDKFNVDLNHVLCPRTNSQERKLTRMRVR